MSADMTWVVEMQRRMGVIQRVLDERERQKQIKGPLPVNRPASQWLAILVEEVGEVADVVTTAIEPGAVEMDVEHLTEELVQVAAVAVAWLETLT